MTTHNFGSTKYALRLRMKPSKLPDRTTQTDADATMTITSQPTNFDRGHYASEALYQRNNGEQGLPEDWGDVYKCGSRLVAWRRWALRILIATASHAPRATIPTRRSSSRTTVRRERTATVS
jgi:hypothetical protein